MLSHISEDISLCVYAINKLRITVLRHRTEFETKIILKDKPCGSPPLLNKTCIFFSLHLERFCFRGDSSLSLVVLKLHGLHVTGTDHSSSPVIIQQQAPRPTVC